MMKIKRREFILANVIVLSMLFYARGITSTPYLQPALLFFPILTLLATYILIKANRVNAKFIYVSLVLLCVGLIFLMQFNFLTFRYGIVNELGRHLYPLLILSLSILIYYKYVRDRKLFITYFFYVATFLLAVDLFFRLMQNGTFLPLVSRYDLKFGGLLFIDSNFNGVLSASLLLLSIFKFYFISLRVKILLFFLVCYSFSLAVYLSLIIILILFFRQKSVIFRWGSVLFLPFIIFIIYDFIAEDGSFLTKVGIIQNSIVFITDFDVKYLLLGLGSGSFKDFFDGASHNLFGIFTEMGLFYIFVFIASHLYLYSNVENRLVILFILIGGVVSLFPISYLSLVYFLLLIGFKGSLKYAKP